MSTSGYCCLLDANSIYMSFFPSERKNVPEYYRSEISLFHTWFKVVEIKEASKDIMSKCFVVSSKQQLSIVSKYSMSPYFVIEYSEK